jgi:hypothetical protein
VNPDSLPSKEIGMGTWNASITANDTAQDLRMEYTAAFYYYEVPEAVRKIDEYVRREMFDETDQDEWCNYYYSLADFMWKKGILTDDVRMKAIEMVDAGFGLASWAEAGAKTLEARNMKLAEFRKQIASTMPERRKIKPNVHTHRIFEDGDLIALQLQTSGKRYLGNHQKEISDDEFHAMDGKYVLIQLIECHSSWTSAIVPEVKDYWALFRLFEGIHDEVPATVDIHALKDARIQEGTITSLFTCECSMTHFKRRKYRLLGNYRDAIVPSSDKGSGHIFLGIDHESYNPDTLFLAAMGKETAFGEATELHDEIVEICRSANRCGRYRYHLSREENEELYLKEEQIIFSRLRGVLAEQGRILTISFGKRMGIVSVSGSRIDDLYISCPYHGQGFETSLLAYALSYVGIGAYIDVPKGHSALLYFCKKAGLKECGTESPEHVRMVHDIH